MLNTGDILETVNMISNEHLDIRTITMGISLLNCAANDGKVFADRIYDKITKRAEKLVSVGEQIEKEYGIPIINKRVSVTPIAIAVSTFPIFHLNSVIICPWLRRSERRSCQL